MTDISLRLRVAELEREVDYKSEGWAAADLKRERAANRAEEAEQRERVLREALESIFTTWERATVITGSELASLMASKARAALAVSPEQLEAKNAGQ